METNRQKKVANIFQEELSEIFRKEAREHFPGVLLTVTSVWVSSDLSVSKIHLSIFPADNQKDIIRKIKEKAPYYRSLIAKTAAKNMRTTPELLFFTDTSLDDMERIEKAISGKGNNPKL